MLPRGRRFRSSAAIAATVAAVLAVAYAANALPSTGSSVVPFSAQEGSAHPGQRSDLKSDPLPPPEAGLERCTTKALELVGVDDLSPKRPEFGKIWRVRLINKGRACALGSQLPDIRALDSEGQLLNTPVESDQSVPKPFTLPANGSARVGLTWGSACADKGLSSFRIAIRIAGDDQTPVPVDLVPPQCNAEAEPFVAFSSWDRGLDAYAQQPYTNRFDGSALSLTLGGLDDMKAGRANRYTLTIRNEASEAINLQPCPEYVMAFRSTSGDETLRESRGGQRSYVLNCEQEPKLNAGESRTFEMVLPASERLPAGGYELSWTLGVYPNPTTPVARATFILR